MKQLLIIGTIAILASQLTAQQTSMGLRCGGLSAVTWKYIDIDGYGVELMLGGQDHGMRFTGLIEKYKPVLTDRLAHLFIFTGLGGHSGYSRYRVYESWEKNDIKYYNEYWKTSPVIGGDFILGAEYRFESIPVFLSLDYKPYFEFFGRKTFRVDLWDLGFTVRYVFNNLKS